jgi:hypothetical protein
MITWLVAVLLLLSIGGFYLNLFYASFTFSSATLEFSGNSVTERLAYTPDKPYHTLYRNFVTPISSTGNSYQSLDHITISSVGCSAGTSYYKSPDGTFYSDSGTSYLSYTENNEYGCGFGDITGFENGKDYVITSEYTLYPSALYEFNGRHYIRFVAYSKDVHPLLERGRNLVISDGALSGDTIFPGIETIIYIPYEPADIGTYRIIKVDRLDFGGGIGLIIWKLILYLLPALICLIVWLLFGKENAEGDYPEELSQPPAERRAWEVSAYFHPPFGNLDENFMPTMIMDFYNRKIIDIQVRKEGLFKMDEAYIKILPIPSREKVDDVEHKILKFLKDIEDIEAPKDGYFSIKHASTRFFKGSEVTMGFAELRKDIKEKSKEHLNYTGVVILSIALILCLPIQLVSGVTLIPLLLSFIIAGIVSKSTSLFLKFKGEYYLEFQQWQGFRKYLSTLDSMKRTPPQGVVLWEKYLVYATALGVGKKVLETLKTLRIIDERTYRSYSIVYMPGAFGGATSTGGAGGGGMGGGGIGGGGGGGR